ncbi:hypothetical protein SAV31267_020040 [Streptomyces avermitilis]|uniref:Uncharacterized protein n=1 Tax=Streptomyces avermitilis TaxID=33903 RepID=A0A4D4MM13_STRAX|nr:hypothetical protein SAV31267_020040 [Streptomyces avermitilis]
MDDVGAVFGDRRGDAAAGEGDADLGVAGSGREGTRTTRHGARASGPCPAKGAPPCPSDVGDLGEAGATTRGA